jgi:succinate-semialdehyde dehydrogenase/glutarate-semialdehyde dehydrogenase
MSAPTQTDPRTRTYRTTNPATGKTIKNYEFVTPEEAEVKLAKAHAAQKEWEKTPIEERVRLYRRFVDLTARCIRRCGPPRPTSSWAIPCS